MSTFSKSNPVIVSVLSRVAQKQAKIGYWYFVEFPGIINLGYICTKLKNRDENGFEFYFFKGDYELSAFANIYTGFQFMNRKSSKHYLTTLEGEDSVHTYELPNPRLGNLVLIIATTDDLNESEFMFHGPRHTYNLFGISWKMALIGALLILFLFNNSY